MGVIALAQAADGLLWIGTTTGLYQFDGARLEPFEPGTGQALRSWSVSVLLALPDGALWIGYHQGGVGSLVRGWLTSWPPGEGLPSGTARSPRSPAIGVVEKQPLPAPTGWVAGKGEPNVAFCAAPSSSIGTRESALSYAPSRPYLAS